MEEKSSSPSDVPSSVPSAVEAFAGSPGSNSPLPPQALGEAAPAQPSTAAPEFDLAAELGKSIGEAMESFTGPACVPMKRVLCKLIGALVREALVVIDDAMVEATTSEHYAPTVDPRTDRSIVLVPRPEGWKPSGVDDVPPNVEVHRQPSPRLADVFARNFNRLELESGESERWAIGPAAAAAACGEVGGVSWE